MKVEVLSGGEVIGVGELDHLDPPMGVAFGPFIPTTAYDRTRHAGIIDRNENDLGLSATLVARGPHGEMKCSAVAIQDAEDALGEIEVSVMGISEFETYFSDHPHYKGYYGLT